MISPCKDCDERNYKCHSRCERYKEFRKFLDKRNDQIRKSKEKQGYFYGRDK